LAPPIAKTGLVCISITGQRVHLDLSCVPGVPGRKNADRAHVAVARSPSHGVFDTPARRSIQTSKHRLRPSGAPRSHAVVLIRRPPSLTSGSRLLEVDPLQSPHVLPAVRPSRAGADTHEVPPPIGGVPPTSPVCDGSSLPSRFRSQVLSTSQRFPGRSKLRGLVSCRRPPLGFNPSEPSSSPWSRTSLEAASSLAVLHRLSSSTSLAARLRSSSEPRGPSLPAVRPCGSPAGHDLIARGLPLRVSPTPAP
jgi:hypothetical protein